MNTLYFCSECRKVFRKESRCTCKQEGSIKEMKVGTPVNIIGTKLKGKVYKIKDDILEVLITSNKNRDIRQYKVEEIRKIL